MKYAGYYMRIALLLLLSYTQLNGQVSDGLLQKITGQMDGYALRQPGATLFVHFDKTVYTANENVWFTGYLLRSTDTLVQEYAMAVALVRNADRSVLVSDQFVLRNGVSFGSMFLPDSLPSGSYTFIAYTNQLVNGYPEKVFRQPVTIKSGETKIIASLKLVDSIKTGTDSVRVLLNARTKDIRMIADADVQYWMGNDSLHRVVSGKVKTDRKGEVFIMVPVKKITGENAVLTAQLQYGKELKTMNLRLPVYRKKPVIKFYPEGGNLVNGLKSTIGWEATNAEGEPLAVNGVLYRNGESVENIQTNAYGIGRFNLVANQKNTYQVKLSIANDSDYLYALPAILPRGAIITIGNTLSNDTLYTGLTSTYAGKLTVILHNFKEVFMGTEVSMDASATRKLIFALNDIPKGVTEITVLDSVGRPLAERVFFAHYNRKAVLTFSTDSVEYHKRGKVALSVKLKSDKGDPLTGLISLACVQDTRIDTRKITDIETYLYLENEMARLPFKKRPLEDEADNREYLDDIFLVKGWRRYTWTAMSSELPQPLQKKQLLDFTGKVVSDFERVIKKPMQVAFLKHGIPTLIVTDNTGNFQVTPEQSETDSGKNMLFVSGKDQSTHMVHMNDPYLEITKKLAAITTSGIDAIHAVEPNTQTLALKDDEFVHLLPQVIVYNTEKDYTIFQGTCADYVCLYNVLNCRNHLRGTKPVNGEVYKNMFGKLLVYKGNCGIDKATGRFLPWKGIGFGKEFYTSDYASFNPPDPELLSTIYWNHSILIKNGEVTVSFYTGDITGKFRIIAQGLADNDQVMYGDTSFQVKAN